MELPLKKKKEEKKRSVKGQEVKCFETSIAFRYPFYRVLNHWDALFYFFLGFFFFCYGAKYRCQIFEDKLSNCI